MERGRTHSFLIEVNTNFYGRPFEKRLTGERCTLRRNEIAELRAEMKRTKMSINTSYFDECFLSMFLMIFLVVVVYREFNICKALYVD